MKLAALEALLIDEMKDLWSVRETDSRGSTEDDQGGWRADAEEGLCRSHGTSGGRIPSVVSRQA